MTNGKWIKAGAGVRVPIFFKVILANSAMALIVVIALLTLHDMRVTAMLIVAACGVVNALLVRTSLTVHALRAQQRELFAWTLHRSEEERSRVARGLQNGAAQRLAALALRSGADRALAGEATAVMQELCDTVLTLQPPRMQLLGLEGALTWYGESLERRLGVAVSVTVSGDLNWLTPERRMGIYRAIEDVVETMARCRPSSIDLAIAASADALAASVRAHLAPQRPNFCAFTEAERFRLSERVACLGGRVYISHGEATVVHITIPQRDDDGGYDSRSAG